MPVRYPSRIWALPTSVATTSIAESTSRRASRTYGSHSRPTAVSATECVSRSNSLSPT